MWRRLVIAATLVLSPWVHAAAEPALGTVTILEGDALITRASSRLHAQEGLRLAIGDIIETSASGFMQIELADHAVLQLGPSSQTLLDAGNAKRKPLEQWFYLMNGWVKFSSPAKDPKNPPTDSTGFDLKAPLFEIPGHSGVVVLHASPGEVLLFVEQGEVKLAERSGGDRSTIVALGSGDNYQRKAGTQSAVSHGAPAKLLGEMPRQFRDSLPLRIDRFRETTEVRPKPAPDFVYADVEPWLNAEPAVRRQFVKRWRSKAQDKEFRAGLVANLSAHPEWDPVLFPEKYLPKPKPPVASAPSIAASGLIVPSIAPKSP